MGKTIEDHGNIVEDMGKIVEDDGNIVEDMGKLIKDRGKTTEDMGKIVGSCKRGGGPPSGVTEPDPSPPCARPGRPIVSRRRGYG